ncbi:hypothetical protein RBSH_02686 [Rhodopirellula baltica SH28]|uniref:Uncharacterized protein n=1 Tax=Rhodopirellula baltica SH28 TaxID=993517 RepID=K5DHQ3_RHOBT|nr:hypothetical protein RBSH_02686 [Rhodopirellula baltica SH28]
MTLWETNEMNQHRSQSSCNVRRSDQAHQRQISNPQLNI